MSDNIAFTPIKGLEQDIRKIGYHEGYIYFAEDSGKIFLDSNNDRTVMGGAGVSVFFAHEDRVSTNIITDVHTLFLKNIEAKEIQPDDLIINTTNGCFYRVINIVDDKVNCYQVAVSGSGSGGGGAGPSGSGTIYIEGLEILNLHNVFKYNETDIITIKPVVESNLDIYGTLICEGFIEDENRNPQKVFSQNINNIPLNQNYDLNLGKILPLYNFSVLQFTLTTLNSGSSAQYKFYNINVLDIGLKLDTSGDFIPSEPRTTSEVTIPVIVFGIADNEKLVFYLNDQKVGTIGLMSSSTTKQTYVFNQSMEAYSSGLNTIKVDLLLNDVVLNTLNIELVWVTQGQNNEPIIWLDSSNQVEGDEYKNVEIKYSIYDPDPNLSEGTVVDVDYYVNDRFVLTSEYIIGNGTSFASWITKEYNVNSNNKYTIKYKWGRNKENEISKDHYIFINKSDIELAYTEQNLLKIAFSPDNRSNSETLRTRTTWTDFHSSKLYTNSFNEYFNWIYNGWMYDEKFNSVLRITNGATFTIPLDRSYYYNKKGQENIYNATFEFQFKVSNVKSYKSIIQQITQYQIKDNTDNQIKWIDEDLFDETTMEKQKNIADYEIIRVKKVINATENDVFCSYGQQDGNNFIGFLLSPEEALFSTGESTVNVKYQKNELITLSFVLGLLDENDINSTDPVRSIKIYLNGVLAGVVTVSQEFLIDSQNIVFNSNICDIDLYGFRFYTTGLNMNEIIQNYLADIKDIETYNQNSIFSANNKNNSLDTNRRINYTNTISYEKLREYNNNADDEHQSMCYAVVTIQEDIKEDDIKSGRLPVYKGDKKKCTIDFYNPSLDRALANDKFNSFTDALPYLPSFHAEDVEINVQGTSSQGYPRRNFKIKTGDGHLYFNDDPENIDYGSEGIRLDDKSNKTNKFTWKIDYMDSSSAHNTGLANLMSEFYNDHPLSRYNDSISYKNKYRTTIYGFPMMVFQKHTYENNNRVNYEFIGKYNFNLDKSSNSYFGFEEESSHPYILSTPYTGSKTPKYSDIAECWEVKNNQGTWTSFKLGANNLNTINNEHGLLSIIDFFEYRYLPKRKTNEEGDIILPYRKKGEVKQATWADYLDWAYNLADPDESKQAENPTEFKDLQKPVINENLKLMHKNIYRLIEWLNSVDYLAATSAPLLTEETFIIEEYFMKPDRSASKPEDYEKYDDSLIYYYPKYNASKSCTDMHKVVLDPSQDGYLNDFEGWTIDNFTTNWSDKVVFEYDENRNNPIYSFAIEKRFQEDSAAYRKAKFKAEFNKHLDKEYCLVYAALTELLLMYDSRGKNMMLASWGPIEENGEYIWFPIFYDLDTQLGLNNSGIPTFEYDTDATNQGAFSTSNSVLWNNLYACFRPEILTTYGTLHNNHLNAKEIEQSYEYTPTKALNLTENSYVQRGVRPLCIHNADEYYKYLAPISTGYWSTNANADMILDDGQYLYACQGTRETYRKSLLKNRFNYLDSDWKAGNYAGSSKLQTAFRLRINANGANTSDYINQNDGPLEANPYFTIEPYLTQYISVLYDKIYTRATDPGKAGLPRTPPASSGFEQGFSQDETSFEQQIVYLPGADTVKSFGDLSLKYIDEWVWPTLENGETINIQNLILGNDESGYYNNKLKTFNLSSSDATRPLLEKVILTGLGAISSSIHAEYCPKLKEFRALGTSITGVILNEGTIIKTLHLPNTTQSLTLLNAINLTDMIKTLPEREEQTYQQYQNTLSQSGLYIENLFNLSEESSLTFLNLKNDRLEYQSYEIFSQLINRYKNTSTKVNLSLNNVNWDPYTIVEKDEELDLENSPYYQTTIYHTYKQLDKTNEEKILNLQEQGKLYKLVTLKGIAPISLEDLITCRDQNNFIGLLQNTQPAITGRLFIKNDVNHPIPAEEIENLENYYDELTIQAAYVDKGVTVVYVDKDNIPIEYKNYAKRNEDGQSYIEITQLSDLLNPKKDQHTFQYWYIDNNDSEDFFNNVKFRKYYIREDEDEIILKPQFLINNYTINFIFDNEEREENINFFIFNSDALLPTPTPNEIPYLDDSELEDDEENGPRRYKFLGFSSQIHTVTSYSIDAIDIPIYYTYSNLNQLPVTNDVDYYAIFQEEYINQVTQADDLEYFYYEPNDLNHTCTIGLIKKLKGKIILPTYTKIPERNSDEEYKLSSEYYRITGIIEYSTTTTNNTSSVSFATNGTNINAIYWYKPSNYPTNTSFQLTIGNKAFYNLSNLQWFDFNTPDIISSIGTSAFENTSLTNSIIKAQSYGNKCFYTGFKRSELDSSGINVVDNKIFTLEIRDGQTSMGTNMIYGWPSDNDSSFEEYDLQNQYFLKLGSNENPYRGGSSVFTSLRKAIRYISDIYWQKNTADTQVTSLDDLVAKLDSFHFENNLVHKDNIHIYYTEDNGQTWDSTTI